MGSYHFVTSNYW